MNINLKGLKFQNWLHLMTFSVLILVVLWVLQFLFLNRFNESMKMNEIREIGDKITSKFDPANYERLLGDYSFNNNLRIVLIDENGKMYSSYDGLPNDPAPGVITESRAPFSEKDFTAMKQNIAASENNRICYVTEGLQNDIRQVAYISTVADTEGKPNYLYVSSHIPPIDTTISVLKTQFILITVILFFLSLIAAQFISNRMAKPIIHLTESAENVLLGEMDATIYENSYTEIHQLALALDYAANELRNLDNYRREFIANISHDLKTPLTIIKFYGEMIKDVSGDQPEKRTAHCETIIHEADWLSNRVAEILELSQLESGNADMSVTDVNLSHCLKDTITSFQVLSEKEGYVFETKIEENIIVTGNEVMLRRVLYNLISNAVNYTGEDKYIYVSLAQTEEGAHFAVTDTGNGIPEEKQKVIWDRYYRMGETHKRSVMGTGIGLSIVKNILIQHHAKYGVISKTDKGSTFWFTLK